MMQSLYEQLLIPKLGVSQKLGMWSNLSVCCSVVSHTEYMKICKREVTKSIACRRSTRTVWKLQHADW
jgi:hypothetical protein